MVRKIIAAGALALVLAVGASPAGAVPANTPRHDAACALAGTGSYADEYAATGAMGSICSTARPSGPVEKAQP